MAANEVLSNGDLVREIVKLGGGSVLETSSSIRSGEPCTAHFDRWKREGCPSDPTEDERRCLEFGEWACGEYATTAGREPVGVFADRLLERLRPGNELVIRISWGDTSVRFERREVARRDNILSIVRGGWRVKGFPCRPADEDGRALLRRILTRSGEIPLGCPENSSARGTVHVPREIEVDVNGVYVARRR